MQIGCHTRRCAGRCWISPGIEHEGRRQEFWAIWSVVFEVVHLPVPDQVLTNLSLDGIVVPLRRYVCTGFRV